MAASKMMLMASLTHCRPLTCAATATARLVPRPPDLIKWVRREGGFIHRGVKILPNGAHGLGLVACEEMSKGSLLIALPAHVPLKFGDHESHNVDGATSVLVNLANKVPGS
ncbi:hypothetical protein K2173_012667 [Erythroxylum novogranatense]|uniref:SET domain-containing protein n=1 Tax=Erythroxylum novogranatense TaxID=1862640 RepID=A0AAV8S693_9ROSI|nr:hypothetical protein K2173_012667 [Erythroxylum novogranatense]